MLVVLKAVSSNKALLGGNLQKAKPLSFALQYQGNFTQKGVAFKEARPVEFMKTAS